MLISMAVFADFLSPTDPVTTNMQFAYTRPQRLYFISSEGQLHLRPFTFAQEQVLDPASFLPIWQPDLTKPYPIKFFVQGYEYKLLGIFPSRLHLYGVEDGGTVFLIGSDKFGRDLWGRICMGSRISLALSMAATLIIIAIGATTGIVSGYYGGWIDNLIQRVIEFLQSFPALALWLALAAVIPITWDQTLIFIAMSSILRCWAGPAWPARSAARPWRCARPTLSWRPGRWAPPTGGSSSGHLLPNCLSHIIVVLTLTIPSIILAESFLSFLGIGIQEPLVSWGTMMREAQSLQTLGSNPWLMWPAAFILVAVLGFNFLGDGLRDAADPYSIV